MEVCSWALQISQIHYVSLGGRGSWFSVTDSPELSLHYSFQSVLPAVCRRSATRVRCHVAGNERERFCHHVNMHGIYFTHLVFTKLFVSKSIRCVVTCCPITSVLVWHLHLCIYLFKKINNFVRVNLRGSHYSNLSVNSVAWHSLAPLFRKCALKETNLEINPWWCHTGHWHLSQVNESNPPPWWNQACERSKTTSVSAGNLSTSALFTGDFKQRAKNADFIFEEHCRFKSHLLRRFQSTAEFLQRELSFWSQRQFLRIFSETTLFL